MTVFFPALAPSYKEIILNAFDQYSLLKAYVRRIMDCYPGIQAEDYEKLEKALIQSLRDAEVDCVHKYLSAKFSDEAIDALVKEMEARNLLSAIFSGREPSPLFRKRNRCEMSLTWISFNIKGLSMRGKPVCVSVRYRTQSIFHFLSGATAG